MRTLEIQMKTKRFFTNYWLSKYWGFEEWKWNIALYFLWNCYFVQWNLLSRNNIQVHSGSKLLKIQKFVMYKKVTVTFCINQFIRFLNNVKITFTNCFKRVRKYYLFTVWKLGEFTLTLFWQNFHESNIFTEEVTK